MSLTHTSAAGRILLAVLAALVGTVGLGLAAEPASASGGWRWTYDHSLGCYRAATYDGNGNGNAEVAWWDNDGDCRLDSVVYDTNGNDNLLEMLWSDVNGDGRWDMVLMDTDQRVGFDYYWVDSTGDGRWDKSGWLHAIQAPAPTNSGSMIIGSPTNPSGFYNLMVTMARITGRATF